MINSSKEFFNLMTVQEALKILFNAIQNDDVGSYYQKIARELRFRFIQFVVEAPGQHQAQNLGLS